MKKTIIILLLLSLYSCDILKESQKVKKDIQASETIKTQIKRKGDTLRLQIPKITYKDTTIVKTNYVNRTEARITYDSKGNADVECISAELDIFKEEIRTLVDNSKEKESKKEESFQSELIIYFMIGMAIIVLGGVYMFLKQNKSILEILNKISS